LQSATAYTFTVTATNSRGTGAASAASNSITATTVPQAPTIGTATDAGTGTSVTVAYTAGATGGAAVSTFTATSSPGSLTGTGASPITVSGLTTGTAYTFTVTATNANGTSTASAASNSVTPASPTSFESIATANPSGTSSVTFSSISSAYKSLQIRAITKSGQTSSADYTDILIAFNGTALTKSHSLSGSGGTVTAGSSTQNIGVTINNHSSLVSNFSPIIIDIIDYASTTKNKTVRGISGIDNSNTYPSLITLNSAFLNSTSAVTSITLSTASATNWIAGTTFALYGIK
jgi:Pyruvate/2-oxoacid:ferredoxin oxidoreductase gamma subunit